MLSGDANPQLNQFNHFCLEGRIVASNSIGNSASRADSTKERHRSVPRRLVNVAIALALVIALFLLVDVREVIHALGGVPIRVLALVLVVLSADRAVMGLKWRHLVNGAGGRMRIRDAVVIYYQSGFAALLLPTSVGGEVLRGFLGQRAGVPLPLLVASMVWEKLVAAVSSVVLAGLAAVYIVSVTKGYDDTILSMVLGSSAIVIGMVGLAAHRGTHEWVGRQVKRWTPKRVFRALAHISAKVVAYRERKALLRANLLFNVGEHVLQFLALYLLALGLGVNFGLLPFLAVTAVAMLARRTLGFLESWGLAEAAVVVIYSLFGVRRELSVGLAFSLWATSIFATLPGAYLLYRNGIRFFGLKRGLAPCSCDSSEPSADFSSP
jgi:glycosyltransferase 2 family protein